MIGLDALYPHPIILIFIISNSSYFYQLFSSIPIFNYFYSSTVSTANERLSVDPELSSLELSFRLFRILQIYFKHSSLILRRIIAFGSYKIRTLRRRRFFFFQLRLVYYRRSSFQRLHSHTLMNYALLVDFL